MPTYRPESPMTAVVKFAELQLQITQGIDKIYAIDPQYARALVRSLAVAVGVIDAPSKRRSETEDVLADAPAQEEKRCAAAADENADHNLPTH